MTKHKEDSMYSSTSACSTTRKQQAVIPLAHAKQPISTAVLASAIGFASGGQLGTCSIQHVPILNYHEVMQIKGKYGRVRYAGQSINLRIHLALSQRLPKSFMKHRKPLFEEQQTTV